MKRSLTVLLIVILTALLLSVTASAADVTSFSDLPETHWAYKTVMPMVEMGLFNGTSEPVDGVGTFSPDKPMTRGEFLAVVCRYYYPDEIYTSAPGLPWWDPYYTIALRNELVGSVEGDRFTDCNAVMTRAEAVTIIDIIMEQQGAPLTYEHRDPIPDEETILLYGPSIMDNDSLLSSVRRCMGEGIISGIDDAGTFDPEGSLTRAAAATIIHRVIDVENRLPKKEYEDRFCPEGEHWYWDKDVKCIKPATETEDGLYLACCANCDHTFEMVLKAHTHNASVYSEKIECGTKVWTWSKCSVASELYMYVSYGEYNAVRVVCGHAMPIVNRSSVSSKEEAEHDYSEWKIISLAGPGTEGRMEKVCTKCGETYVKTIPMYSSAGTVLDIRDSYGSSIDAGKMVHMPEELASRVRPVIDEPFTDVDTLRRTLNGFVGVEYSLRFFDDGISINYADDGQCAKIVKHDDGRFGINVFGWRKNYDSHGGTNSCLNMVMEAIYYISGDREVAYALWNWIDAMNINGRANSDDFGFRDIVWTDSQKIIQMKNIQIEYVSGNGNGSTFYFSKV